MSDGDDRPTPLRPNQDALLRLRGLPARPVSENEPGTVDPRDAEIADLKRQLAEYQSDFTALQHAIVGDIGLSAILEAGRLRRARVETLTAALREVDLFLLESGLAPTLQARIDAVLYGMLAAREK